MQEKVTVTNCAIYDLLKKFHLKGVVEDLPTRFPYVAITHMATPHVTIPRIAHMINCMRHIAIFYEMRKLSMVHANM